VLSSCWSCCQYATHYIREKVASSLGLASDAPVTVKLSSGSILLQAATGHINSVTITIDPLTLNGLSGSATLTGHDVPLSRTQPVTSLDAVVRIPAATVRAAIAKLPGLAQYDPKVTISGDHADVTASIAILGFTQSLGITLTPKVTNGSPGLSIEAITFDGASISTAQLAHYVPSLGGVLSTGVSLCIADQLPKSLVLTGVAFKGQTLVSTFTGDGTELNSASLGAKGTCPD
jgi:hypothetical protein